MTDNIKEIRIANLFLKSKKISNKKCGENDPAMTDIEAGEDDFFLGFVGKKTRMSICSTTTNNNLLVDDTRRVSVREISPKVNSFIGSESVDVESGSNWKIPIETFSSKK